MKLVPIIQKALKASSPYGKTKLYVPFRPYGLERARYCLKEAAALRERFVLGKSACPSVAAAASTAEAAAAAGESTELDRRDSIAYECAGETQIIILVSLET